MNPSDLLKECMVKIVRTQDPKSQAAIAAADCLKIMELEQRSTFLLGRLKTLIHHCDYELDMVRQSDGEHGVQWLNESASEEWKQKNPALLKWMIDLRAILDKINCPECGGSGTYTSEAQARTTDPIMHNCDRCHGTGIDLLSHGT